MYKVWITTMYSGEGDFNDCVNMISRQKNIDFDHHIIYHKNELDAHKSWVEKWLSVRNNYDFNVKIDADTVLRDENVISNVCDIIKEYDGSAAQIKIHDYITDTMISGLNFFTKETNFIYPDNDLYCDRVTPDHRKLLHCCDGYFPEYNENSPIALHCHYATEKQGFHFGVHRGLKNRKNEYELVKKACKENKCNIRFAAIMGFENAYLFKSNHNYTDKEFKKLFKKFLKNSPNQQQQFYFAD